MEDTPIKLTEEQAIARLADEKWWQNGNAIVSKDSFSPEAVAQYLSALSQNTRNILRIRSESRSSADPSTNSKGLTMNLAAAQKLFSVRGLSITVDGVEESRSR